MVAFNLGLGWMGSPQPNGCNQAGGYEQCTTFTFFRHASQCRRTKSEQSSAALEVFGGRSISEVIVEELPTIRSEPNCHIRA